MLFTILFSSEAFFSLHLKKFKFHLVDAFIENDDSPGFGLIMNERFIFVHKSKEKLVHSISSCMTFVSSQKCIFRIKENTRNY